MGMTDTAKELCCTWDGQYRLKKIMAMFCGVMVILSSVFALIDVFDTAFNLLNTIQTCWNLVFGVLMCMHEFKCSTWITLRFGFLNGWFGRGMFYLFVGTIIMGKGKDGFWNTFSYFVGFCCIFIGAIELLFGFKCAATSETAQAEDAEAAVANGPPAAQTGAAAPKKSGGFFGGGARAQTSQAGAGPTLTVTPGQVAGAANWAAQNPGTVASVANAAAPVAAAGGSAAASNPFFGNGHLADNRQ